MNTYILQTNGYTLKEGCQTKIEKHKHLCWVSPKGWGKTEKEICSTCVEKYNKNVELSKPKVKVMKSTA